MLSKHVDVDDLLKKVKTDKVFSIRSQPDKHSYAYASRIHLQQLPKYSIPEETIDSDHAYQIVKDELELDGKPSQNCASFVTTYLEDNCQKLMLENITKNLADVDEYPQTAELQNRCVAMIASLFHRPKDCKPVGTACIGSSEGILLAGLAMKFIWRNKRKEQGLPCDKPNIIFGHQAHCALEKFARYFDVEPRIVSVSKESHYCMDPKDMLKQVDENTIGIMAILGSTYTGHFENIKQMNDDLIALEKEKGWSVPIHIDAASGGFIVPFSFPELLWDFRLEKVISVNVSGHKFGYVVAGVGWIVWKDAQYLPKELIFELHYLGGTEESFNLNFSRSAAHVIAQYYNFIRLGKQGFKTIANNCRRNALLLARCLEASEYFEVVSDLTKPSLPVVSFTTRDKRVDPYIVSSRLRSHGWIVPAYTLPPTLEKIVILRIVVRENFSEDVVDLLLRDLLLIVESLLKEREDLETIIEERIKQALHEHITTDAQGKEQAKTEVATAVAAATPPVKKSDKEKEKELTQVHRDALSNQQAEDNKDRENKTYSRVC